MGKLNLNFDMSLNLSGPEAFTKGTYDLLLTNSLNPAAGSAITSTGLSVVAGEINTTASVLGKITLTTPPTLGASNTSWIMAFTATIPVGATSASIAFADSTSKLLVVFLVPVPAGTALSTEVLSPEPGLLEDPAGISADTSTKYIAAFDNKTQTLYLFKEGILIGTAVNTVDASLPATYSVLEFTDGTEALVCKFKNIHLIHSVQEISSFIHKFAAAYQTTPAVKLSDFAN